MKTEVFNIGLFLLLLLGVISCNIKEDRSDCPGTILLDYTSYSKEVLDKISPNEQVNVYIFDDADICCEIYTFTYSQLKEIDFEFPVPIEYNGNNAVVWHGNNARCYADENIKLGESLDNFYLSLIYNVQNNSFADIPDPLWASELEPIEYCASKTRHRIHMTRLHTLVDVKINKKCNNGDIVPLDMRDYKLSISAITDVYHVDYSVCSQSHALIYNSKELLTNEPLEFGHVGTLRLMKELNSELYITNVESGDRLNIGGKEYLDLVKYMLSTQLESDNTEPQRFLDLNKDWVITLLIEEGAPELPGQESDPEIAIMLDINGWTVWFDYPDLS